MTNTLSTDLRFHHSNGFGSENRQYKKEVRDYIADTLSQLQGTNLHYLTLGGAHLEDPRTILRHVTASTKIGQITSLEANKKAFSHAFSLLQSLPENRRNKIQVFQANLFHIFSPRTEGENLAFTALKNQGYDAFFCDLMGEFNYSVDRLFFDFAYNFELLQPAFDKGNAFHLFLTISPEFRRSKGNDNEWITSLWADSHITFLQTVEEILRRPCAQVNGITTAINHQLNRRKLVAIPRLAWIYREEEALANPNSRGNKMLFLHLEIRQRPNYAQAEFEPIVPKLLGTTPSELLEELQMPEEFSQGQPPTNDQIAWVLQHLRTPQGLVIPPQFLTAEAPKAFQPTPKTLEIEKPPEPKALLDQVLALKLAGKSSLEITEKLNITTAALGGMTAALAKKGLIPKKTKKNNPSSQTTDPISPKKERKNIPVHPDSELDQKIIALSRQNLPDSTIGKQVGLRRDNITYRKAVLAAKFGISFLSTPQEQTRQPEQ